MRIEVILVGSIEVLQGCSSRYKRRYLLRRLAFAYSDICILAERRQLQHQHKEQQRNTVMNFMKGNLL